MPETPRSVKATLSSLHTAARKSLGQNFMTEASDLRFIAQSMNLKPGETVLEIGPGLGALTRALLDTGAAVVAVEKDERFSNYLKKHLKDRNVEIHHEDILRFDLPGRFPEKKSVWVAGNIPYQITSLILFWIIEHRAWIRGAVLTMQWEVAERLTGRPGNKSWGALSVSAQTYAQITLLKKIPKAHFFPIPKVDSAVVQIRFLSNPKVRPDVQDLFHTLVSKAFQKRRKTLQNSLEHAVPGLDKMQLLETFLELDLDPRRRPETLSVEEWAALAVCLGRRFKK